MARRHRPGCLPRPAHGRAWTRALWGGLVNDTPLTRLPTRAAPLAAVWAAAVTVMRRLRHRRRRPLKAVPEAIPVTPSYTGGAGTPLVLLHGVGGTWRGWRPVLPLLERCHAVFAPPLPRPCGAEPLAPRLLPPVPTPAARLAATAPPP